ncbi:thiamine pyrophosphate-binding protein [Bradyrhizobium sp. RDT10]
MAILSGIYDALFGQQEISHILVRHEQHAASMAAGYAQLTGDVGVCCVTAGPGATNLVTGVAEAFVGALPIVIIAGRGATRNAHRGARSGDRPGSHLWANYQVGYSRRSSGPHCRKACGRHLPLPARVSPARSWSTSRKTFWQPT